MIDADNYYAVVNFADESVALMQWLIEQNLQAKTKLLLVDTGFAADSWQTRVERACQYAATHNLSVVKLISRQDFSTLVKERGEFPSKKFQWCAGLLKGTALNDYLDEQDPFCESVLLFAKRQENSRVNQLLSDTIEESEHYNERTIHFPLWECSTLMRNELVAKTTLPLVNHRSLECQPCIHASKAELLSLDPKDTTRLRALEASIGKDMFSQKSISDQSTSNERFEMGCGSYFGCGE